MNFSIKNTIIIAKRELLLYFVSPLAYVFIVIFLILAGFFTFAAPPFGNFLETNTAALSNSFFLYHPWLYILLVPAISMRMWAEEQNLGTIELLFTMPITVSEAVIGKFIAALSILLSALILTFPIVITVNWLGNPDNFVIFAGYFASFLLAATYLSIGTITSALTRNQLISFIASVFICLVFVLLGHPSITDFFKSWAPVGVVDAISNFGFFPYFAKLQKGIIDLQSIVYFLSFIIFSLVITGTILKNKSY